MSLNYYSYGENNPLKYADPSGHVVETILDIASIGWSAYDLWKNPSLANAGYLLWDVGATFVPVLPGSYVVKGGKIVSTVVKGSDKAYDAKNVFKVVSKGCNCFTAGTKVLTDKGEKNIEDIKVGDKVLSKDENNPNGKLAYKEVTALHRNQRDDIIKLHVGKQIIETTDNHPFWVDGKGWIFADELQVGDKLLRSDKKKLTINKVEFVKLDKPVTVYNFTVDDYHTYYVTDLGIWVHNSQMFCGSASDLVHLAINSKSIDGLKDVAVSAELVNSAAIEFVGKGATLKKIDGGLWYVSKDGTKRVRTGQKSKGAYEANFETLDKKGNVKTNYHVQIR